MRARNGFSIFEVVTTIAIFGMIATVFAVMQVGVLRSNQLSRSQSSIDQKSLIFLRNFSTELRAAQTPNDGSIPLLTTTENEIAFYVDKDDDNIVERIRYWIDGDELKRGVLVPTGEPLTYNAANETEYTLLDNILPASPYFTYYGSNFDGATSTPPLTQPVVPSEVRLVELRLSINTKVANQEPRIVETRVTVRSLKNK